MPNPWEAHLRTARKYLSKSIIVDLSMRKHSPYFVVELAIGLLFVFALWSMNRNLNQVYRDFKERQAVKSLVRQLLRCTRHQRMVQQGSSSRRRPRRVAWRNRRRVRWLDDEVLHVETKRTYIDRLTALTPKQFVRLDKERQLRNRQTQNCMRSLTTLFTNVVAKRRSRTEMREHIACAKESCAISHVAGQVMTYMDSVCVTDSLISVMSDLIDETTIDGGSTHFHADLTTLVCDIGNLSKLTLPPHHMLNDLHIANPPKLHVGTR